MADAKRRHVKRGYSLHFRLYWLLATHLILLILPNAIVPLSSIDAASIKTTTATSTSAASNALRSIRHSGDVIGSPLGVFLDDVGMKKADLRRERLRFKHQNKSGQIYQNHLPTAERNRSGAPGDSNEDGSRRAFEASKSHSAAKYAHIEGMDERVDYIAHFYVMPGLLVLGFANQCLNIITLSTLPLPGYLYLKASAVADVLSMLAIIPFCIRHGNIHSSHSYWAMLYHAHVELPLINSFITASALCLVGMTIDRYVSIRHPIAFFNSADSRSRIRLTIAIIFAVALLIFIPSGWQKEVVPDVIVGTSSSSVDEHHLHHHHYFDESRPHWRIQRNYDLNHSSSFKIYLLFREFIARIGPVIILVVLNAEMIRSLRQITARHTERRARQDNITRARDNDRNRISVLLLITSATFVICTLPASLLSLFIDYTKDGLGMQIFRAFANLLQVSHFLFNFYLYTIFSTEYRLALLTLFGCRKGRSPGATDESPAQLLSNSRLAQRAAKTKRVVRYERVNSKPLVVDAMESGQAQP